MDVEVCEGPQLTTVFWTLKLNPVQLKETVSTSSNTEKKQKTEELLMWIHPSVC